ncbi:MAG: FUSC family protein [Acidimicrobiia bacterium]
MTFLRRVWDLLRDVDRSTFEVHRPLRAAIVMAVVLSIVIGHADIRAALPMGVGMLFTAMSDTDRDFSRRIVVMAGTSVAIAPAALLGGFVSNRIVVHVIVAGAVALVCGFIGSLGPAWLRAGVLTLVVFTIFSGSPIDLLGSTANFVCMAIGSALLITSATLEHVVSNALGRRSAPPDDRVRPIVSAATDTLVSRLRPHFTRVDAYVLHAVRLAVVIMVATVIAEETSLPHSYWIPMTAAWITRPDFDGTVNRIILRVAGTLIGVVIAGFILNRFDPGTEASVLLASGSAFVVLAFVVSSYGIAVIGITGFVLFLFHIIGYSTDQTIVARVIGTLVAAGLVAVAIRIGPRRLPERTGS